MTCMMNNKSPARKKLKSTLIDKILLEKISETLLIMSRNFMFNLNIVKTLLSKRKAKSLFLRKDKSD